MEPEVIKADAVTSIRAAAPENKITMNQVLAYAAGLLISAAGTYITTRPAAPPVPAVAPVVVTAPVTTQTPATAPQAPPAGPVWQPAPACHDYTGPVTLKVGTLTIEAGVVELRGDVRVSIPEIKLPPPAAIPTFTVDNTLPPEVITALLNRPPAPVVNVRIDPAAPVRAAVLPTTPDPADVLETVTAPPTPRVPAPVRVWPKAEGGKP